MAPILVLFILYSEKFFEKGETRNVSNNNGFSMSDPTREMKKNPREKTHYHKTLSSGGTTAIVETM